MDWLEIMSALSAVITILSLFWALFIKLTAQHHTWRKLEKYTEQLAEKIKEGTFSPDIVFTPSSLCSSIAYLVTKNLDRRLPIIVGLREDISDAPFKTDLSGEGLSLKVSETPKWRHYLPNSLCKMTGKNILIVDDFVMTGSSLEGIKKSLLECGFKPENLRTATLICSEVAKKNKAQSDYYLLASDKVEHYFPWGKAK